LADQLPKIPTPWHLQWRRIRYQFVPVLTLICSVLATGWLWNRRMGTVNTYGRVQVIQADATSPLAGVLIPLIEKPVELYAEVEAQQVVARLDGGSVDRELAAGQRELEELRHELKSREGVPSTRPVNPQLASMGVDQLHTAITNVEVRIEDLEFKLDSLEVRAPISGRVTQLVAVPGQAVIQGQIIMTITSDVSSQVISYIRQDQRFKPTAGMPVVLRSQIEGATVAAEVKQVGPRVEAMPTQQLRDPRTPEWGIPVIISIPPDMKFRPGELVEVRFRHPDPPPTLLTAP
jgi:multidrug resistance efflux pump